MADVNNKSHFVPTVTLYSPAKLVRLEGASTQSPVLHSPALAFLAVRQFWVDPKFFFLFLLIDLIFSNI